MTFHTFKCHYILSHHLSNVCMIVQYPECRECMSVSAWCVYDWMMAWHLSVRPSTFYTYTVCDRAWHYYYLDVWNWLFSFLLKYEVLRFLLCTDSKLFFLFVCLLFFVYNFYLLFFGAHRVFFKLLLLFNFAVKMFAKAVWKVKLKCIKYKAYSEAGHKIKLIGEI